MDSSSRLHSGHGRLTSGQCHRSEQFSRAVMTMLVILVTCAVLVSGHRHGLTATSDQPKVPHDDPSSNQGPSDNTVDMALQQDQWATLAKDNVLRMGSDSIRCATPRPRVVKVQDFHPHAHKRFVPSCIELHRCDRQSGCCDEENSVCSPLKKHKVFMYFFVVSLQDDQDGGTSVGVHGQVERLRFNNHTKCACRKRKPQDKPPLIGQSVSSGGAASIQRWLLLAPVVLTLLNRWSK